MARYPYTYGTATSVANTSFELVFDPALYPLQAPGRAAWQYEASSIMGFNAAEWRMASDPVVDLQGSFALAPGAAANRLVVSGAGALAGIADGGSYVLRHAQLGCGGFCFASCTNVLLSHVDVWPLCMCTRMAEPRGGLRRGREPAARAQGAWQAGGRVCLSSKSWNGGRLRSARRGLALPVG